MTFALLRRRRLHQLLSCLWLAGMLSCGGRQLLLAADSAQDQAAAIKDLKKELEQLRKDNEKLRETNNQLRQENQQQRKMLAELIEPISAARVVTPTAPAATNLTNVAKLAEARTNDAKPKAAVSEAPAVTHWLSFSGKRHNSTCRYFKYPGGNPCGPTDGVACRLCGG